MKKRIVFISALTALLFVCSPAYAQEFESVKFAIEEICGHIMGHFGSLLLMTAGVGALVSAAVGNFRASQTLFVVAIGAFGTSATLSLYFSDAAEVCDKKNSEIESVEKMGPARRTATPFQSQISPEAQSQRSIDAAVGVASGRINSGIQTGDFYESPDSDSDLNDPF